MDWFISGFFFLYSEERENILIEKNVEFEVIEEQGYPALFRITDPKVAVYYRLKWDKIKQ